ncbi:MAG: hypothetical protein OEM26_01740 [Saprospiraceae bacterium]|nr:hypothetical protein [Saprospiraceae bacterium]
MRYLLTIYPLLLSFLIDAQNREIGIDLNDKNTLDGQRYAQHENDGFLANSVTISSTKYSSTWVHDGDRSPGGISNHIKASTIEPFLNLRAKFYQDQYILVMYSGSNAAFCYVTDETGRTVHRYAGLLGKEPALMNIDYLPKGRYHLNIEVAGKLYQRAFYREEVINFGEEN